MHNKVQDSNYYAYVANVRRYEGELIISPVTHTDTDTYTSIHNVWIWACDTHFSLQGFVHSGPADVLRRKHLRTQRTTRRRLKHFGRAICEKNDLNNENKAIVSGCLSRLSWQNKLKSKTAHFSSQTSASHKVCQVQLWLWFVVIKEVMGGHRLPQCWY